MTRSLHGRRLIIGVDRLDYSKGLLERFDAYQKFLEKFPQFQGAVTYLQIAPLGRQNVTAYGRIRTALEQNAGRTNGRFADVDWTPIRYVNRNFPHPTLLGFLRLSQVCLVTPLRDGMNLVAKEFVAAQDPADPGVLILSDHAGAAEQLARPCSSTLTTSMASPSRSSAHWTCHCRNGASATRPCTARSRRRPFTNGGSIS